MKQIQIKSKSPIEIHADDFLEAINVLRKEYGKTKKDKIPIELSKVLPNINLFQNRDAERGMLSFQLSYEDADEIPCTRDFPNFGLDVESDSKLEQKDNKLFLSVSFTVKAGKPKWQLKEISECATILTSGKCRLSLNLTLDETTDWGGHSVIVITAQDTTDSPGIPAIPSANFIVETK
jgi:hypothetical protein